MPNLIYCTLSMQGNESDIHSVKESLKTTDSEGKLHAIDFQNIIPMPPSLNINRNNDAELLYKRDYLRQILWVDEEQRLRLMYPEEAIEASDLAQKYHENMLKYRAKTWYHWCIKHWGTKWNAIINQEDAKKNTLGDTLYFATAWNPPIPVINFLVCKFPNVHFTLEYFDEHDHDDITTVEFKLGEPKT